MSPDRVTMTRAEAIRRRREEEQKKRESQMPFLARDTRFDPLHNDPRYQDLVRRLALPQ